MPIVVTGLKQAIARFLKADQVLQAELVRVMEAFGRRMEGQIKARTPVGTGRLRSSIKYRIEMTGARGMPSLTVGSMAAPGGAAVIYARFREFGGTIKPIKGKYLVWLDTRGGRNPMVTRAGASGIRARNVGQGEMTGSNRPALIFARQVTQKGSHYLYPVVQENVPLLGRAIAIAIAKTMGSK